METHEPYTPETALADVGTTRARTRIRAFEAIDIFPQSVATGLALGAQTIAGVVLTGPAKYLAMGLALVVIFLAFMPNLMRLSRLEKQGIRVDLGLKGLRDTPGLTFALIALFLFTILTLPAVDAFGWPMSIAIALGVVTALGWSGLGYAARRVFRRQLHELRDEAGLTGAEA
ncbi:hypothetical protein AADG42_03520 [Ammonicoccus fulvus]|uniref:Uncharacterized protein n=1 Tax=Ammonicoccus fulvus TaxID=3138240 RepID=A0ABZ3FNM9_9ACTN